MKKRKTISLVGTVLFTFLGLLYIAPILVVLINSFKKKAYISL